MYIYIRMHEAYNLCDACKLGHTNNIPERDSTYATGEIKRGTFTDVFQILSTKYNSVHIERLLQTKFKKYNIIFDAGKEFYKKDIIEQIEPILTKLNIEYKRLTYYEIKKLTRFNRVIDNLKILFEKIKKTSLLTPLIQISYSPRDYQQIIIDKAFTYFTNNDKGLLVLTCGIGKTLISLWIAKALQTNTILIGVPNKLLLKQWANASSSIFTDVPCLIVCDNLSIENIETFIKSNKKFIIITTYSSAHKVYKATCGEFAHSFHMKINDECHHLTSLSSKIYKEDSKEFIQMLNIPSIKQLSLTATPKHIEQPNDLGADCGTIISNNNRDYFGDIIDSKCLLWAITEKIICDYVIQTIITKEAQLEQPLASFNITEENDKRLFLSAYASLKSISAKHSHHILIYSNNKENSVKLMKYIKMLINDNYFNIPNLYYSNYNGDMKPNEQAKIINSFENAQYGIIACVYCLGEGWDFPLLDAVVFAENMTSNIRIVQAALRASRKDRNDSNKKTKIILPILNSEDWLESSENTDLKKVREVIYHMSLEDETIIQKIKVYRIDIEKPHIISKKIGYANEIYSEYDYDDELTKQLRLKTINRIALDITYEKAKKIIAEQNIKNKDAYYELCDKDSRLSLNPEEIYKSKFKNWVDYLSIDKVYYDLETCKNKVNAYISLYPDIKKNYLELSIICNELCKIDSLFPPFGLWVDYYNVKDLRDIIIISNKKKIGGIAF